MRNVWCLFICLLACLYFFHPSAAHAATSGVHVFNDVSSKFKAAVVPWGNVFLKGATTLFWGLVPIAMVWKFAQKAMQGGGLSDVLAEFIRFTVFIGFYFWLCQNGLTIAQAIINSMEQLAGQATGKSSLSPSEIMDVGFSMFTAVLNTLAALSWRQIPEGIFLLLGGLVFMIIIALVAVNMLLAIISAWILMYAGVFILGFGGSSWTSEMAIGYFRSMLSAGLRIAGMILVVGVCSSVMSQYTTNPSNLKLADIATLIVVAIVMYLLSEKIPEQLAGLPSGATGHNAAISGGGALAGTAASAAMLAQGMKMAMAMATGAGGAAMAVQAALEEAGKDLAHEAGADESRDTGSAGSLSEAMGDADGDDFGDDAISGADDSDSLGSADDEASDAGGGEAGSAAGGEAAGGGEAGSAAGGEAAGGGEAGSAAGGGAAGGGEAGSAAGGGAAGGGEAGSAAGGGAAGGGEAGSAAGGVISGAMGHLARAATGMAKQKVSDRLAQTKGGKLAAAIHSNATAGRISNAMSAGESMAQSAGLSADGVAAAGRASAAAVRAGGNAAAGNAAAREAISAMQNGVSPSQIAPINASSVAGSGSSNAAPEPWMSQTGGFEGLSAEHQASAEASYANWKAADPEGHTFDLNEYVSYTQDRFSGRSETGASSAATSPVTPQSPTAPDQGAFREDALTPEDIAEIQEITRNGTNAA